MTTLLEQYVAFALAVVTVFPIVLRKLKSSESALFSQLQDEIARSDQPSYFEPLLNKKLNYHFSILKSVGKISRG